MGKSDVIYILTNPSFPQFVKIGYADDVLDRVATLNSNPGLPYSFRIFATYEVNERLEDLIADANIQIEVTAGLVEKLVRENANVSQDQEEYESKYNALASRFDEAKIILKESEEERLQKTARKKELEAILQKMIEADTVLLEWSDELWLTLIDECVAHEDKTISFKFKNGYEITK